MTPRTRPRVTVFNRSYWPDTGATGQLLAELCEDLVSVHGFEVTVISGVPVSAAPGTLPAVEVRHGVRIVRASGTRFDTRRFAGRATNYVTYFLSALARAMAEPRPDVAVALTDPPIIGLAALAARPRRGMVFFCQDIFPEVAGLLDDFRSPLVNAVLERVGRFLVRRAARVVALGETMAARLVEGKGADPGRVTIVHNWADTSVIVPSERSNAFSRAHGLDGRFVLLHAGNIGFGQNLDVVIDAAALLIDRPDILVLFIGDGNRRPALEAAVGERGLANVRFLPFQPRDQLRWTYASADACLVSLKPGLAGYIVPSKLYPILAAGRPYLAAVDADSEVAAITGRHRCGLLVPADDAAALAAAIRGLADAPAERQAMGARAREAAMLFARDRQVAAHAAVLRAVIEAAG
jgi:glycosyltransferase involved in cell wall biosynthesis